MFSGGLYRMPFYMKGVLVLSIVVGCFAGMARYIYGALPQVMADHYGVDITSQVVFAALSPVPFLGSLVCILLILLLVLLDSRAFFRTINGQIKFSLEDRKLYAHFSHFYSAVTYRGVVHNVTEVYALYKAFDNMKTARVVLETATIKQLMNVAAQGLILINKELVVTHINHRAEQYLGLIPSECIGQAISRKISNPILLGSLEKVFDVAHKELELPLGEGALVASIYPLKDKFGDIIRALVVLKEKKEKEAVSPATPSLEG